VPEPNDWPGHQGGRVRTTELNGGMVGGIDCEEVATILRFLEPYDGLLFVRVDGLTQPLIVDKVVEVKRDDFGDQEGTREVYLHARPHLPGKPIVSFKALTDRLAAEVKAE
jgi:hypothetical protein